MKNKSARDSENMQKGKLINRFNTESIFPVVVCTIIVSAILYFANSREFYLVQNEDRIRHKNYKIIPPSDHLIHSGEAHPIHIMVKTPLKGLEATAVPVSFCFLYVTVTLLIKKEK